MSTMTDYQITAKIYESSNSLVYRAILKSTNQPIILKILQANYPTPSEIARYQQEYEITRSLNLDGVVKAYGLQRYQNSLVMLLEDFGGESLKHLMKQRQFTLEEFLTLGIKIADSLGAIHAANIIHKDINPANIVYNPKTGQLKIIDFGISSILSRENPTTRNPNQLEGTLVYISPEQTGRMNRSIDYRTDFYSLGVTFYELLTNQLPFATNDTVELVHCHIAKQPVPVHLFKEEVPKAVSAIVMKLMAKTAEERYQSAWGLKADLETCLHQLQSSGQISEFPLARQDFSDKFQIPQKLYGRETEVNQLLATFERVSQGTTEMMLVAGYSGIGKSAFVNEVHKPIVRQRGYFISGKFDQFKRNSPYASILQAFQELIRQLLSESELQIQNWKTKLLEALGTNGKLIIDVIPELKLMIGEQPSVPELGLTESQNRFNLVFQKFISVFTKKEHPLVIFLDDLQWADSASLKLIELLITDPDSQYLLMIGAYRDNEVSLTHPLTQTLDQIQKAEIKVNTITLGPLNINHVNQLIVETLRRSPQAVKPMAKLLFNKTNGNPFFLIQLLQSLHQEKLVLFNTTIAQWQWDIDQIKGVDITDNVIDLMIQKIEKLEPINQDILKLSACIGNPFNLEILALLHQKSLADTATELWSVVQEGLIVPMNDAYKILMPWHWESESIDNLELSGSIPYKFLHDRVQQAAYALIPEERKKEIHLRIGQLLLKNTPAEELDETIFDIVNQLNIGSQLITNQSERDELAKLNLMAGQKAKASTAYEPALRYLEVGLGLLAPDSWQYQYDLTLELHIDTVEAQYLNTQFQQAEQLATVVLQKAQTLLDKIKVYELKIQSYTSQLNLQLAIDTALEVLALLGIVLSQKPNKRQICEEQKALELLLKDQQIDDLINLPKMTDPYKLAAIRILLAIAAPAYVTNPPLFARIGLSLVNLFINYGNSNLAAAGYILYGNYLCGTIGDTDLGYKFGQLSLKLLEQFDSRAITTFILHNFNTQVRHWKDPIKETLDSLLIAIKIGLENGDLEYSSYAVDSYCANLFFMGENLFKIEQEIAKYTELLINLKQEYSVIYAQLFWQTVLVFLKTSSPETEFSGEVFEECEITQKLVQTNNYCTLYHFYVLKSIIMYLFNKYSHALESTITGKKYEGYALGMIATVQHNFYDSLSLLSLYVNENEANKKQALKKVLSNQKHLKKWAYHCPANYQHKYELVEAEKARVLGKQTQAMELYDRAIQGARDQGFIHEEAIAYERAAEFYLSIGRAEIGQFYLKNAYHAYSRWGAIAKVKALEAEYPQILVGTPNRSRVKSSTTTDPTADGEALDLATILKASQALTSEIALTKLLEKLMKIAIENAGAQKGFLILDKAGNWVIEAEAAVGEDKVTTLRSHPVDAVDPSTQIPLVSAAIINYVANTQKTIVLNDATHEGQFTRDPYILATQPQSILCTPLLNQGKLGGILYLENNLTTEAFTPDRVETLSLLCTQAAISIQNSRLYAQLQEYSRTLEQNVEARTQELQVKNQELASTLQKLKATQDQIIAQEKLASLGALTAGIAHEIKNPLNFVNNFAELSAELSQELLEELNHQKDRLDSETQDYIAELLNDLEQNVKKINEHGKRADSIVRGMLMHSGGKTGERQLTDINALLGEYVNLAYHGMRAKDSSFNITIETDYDQTLGQIKVVPQNMSRVFLNLINNACYATHEKKKEIGDGFSPTLSVRTKNLGDQIEICIRDNGKGILPEHLDKIFNPFFTTKPTGQGTGLGLSISHDIVVQEHQGEIKVKTELDSYAEFTIILPKES